jgi:hypothetical protein
LARNTTFSKGIEQARPAVAAKVFPTMFRHNGILKIVSDTSPKFLWLIPFTLAKKLLSYGLPVAKNNFVVTVCGSKSHARADDCPYKTIWGKDPLVRSAVCGYNKKN